MPADPSSAAPDIDLTHLRTWVGRSQTDDDQASVRHARLMAATVARSDLSLDAGQPLPPLWHWLFFLEGRPPAELGRDGHPARGGFLPPVPLSNRMWAGGRVWFDAPIPLGSAMRRQSQVLKVDHKQGRSGDLVFVTVGHEVWADGQRCVREEQDLVYKAPTPRGTLGDEPAPPAPGAHVRPYAPDATLLFRYSALTFNGHRIHYDLDYCRAVEGYDNLVIHGPLSATMLAQLAQQVGAQAGLGALRQFSYRGVRPAILGRPLTLNANLADASPMAESRLQLWTALANGQPSMQADAVLG
jgi:3-methylfumaryl-CoA hydratase